MVYDDANTLFGTICRELFETCGSNDDARGATMTIYARNMKKTFLTMIGNLCYLRMLAVRNS